MKRLIGCGEAVENLWEFLDQGLDEHDHRAVEEHLAFCVQCCGELEFARQLRNVLQAKGTAELPAGVRARLDHYIAGLIGEPETGNTR